MIESSQIRLSLRSLLVLALTAFPVQAQTHLPMGFGDIEITLQSVPQGDSSHGYCEYVFLLRNQSADRPHNVTLSIPFEKYRTHRGDHISDLRRTVHVGAKETVLLSLLQPDHPPIGGSGATVFVDGRRHDNELPLRLHESRSGRGYSYYGYLRSPRGGSDALLLISSHVGLLPQLPAPAGAGGWGGGWGEGPGGGLAPPGKPPPPVHRDLHHLTPEVLALPCIGSMEEMIRAWNTLDMEILEVKTGLPANSHQAVNPESVETWSSNWLAYSRYDGVLITGDELKALPASVRMALWQYVETGGFLFVVGPADLQGLSAVVETSTDAAGWKTVRAGLGLCLVSPNAQYDKWDAAHFDRLNNTWKDELSHWRMPRSTANSHLEFPVVEDLGVPVKGLFALMVLFVVGIGPINLLTLLRMKRRIWMLWTTPLISLATCAAVFGYMLISEGWEGQLRTETLTLLDENTHRATTIGWTGFYSPLTPGGGLHFSSDTEVIPQRYFEDSRAGGGRSCTIDWTQDQHFAAGWVEARIPAHFKVRKSEISRKRVTLERLPDGRWKILNGLGAAIRRFWYADAKGQIHTAEDIEAGARASLVPSEKECQVPSRNIQGILNSSWTAGIKQVAKEPQHYLRPGLYFAEVDDSPFLDDALHGTKKRKAHALILGFQQQRE